MRTSGLLTMLLLLGGCTGDSAPLKDSRTLVDEYVQEKMTESQTKKAINFLKSGGHHYDLATEEPTTVDRDVLLPLLEELRSKFKLDPIAILETDEEATYIYEIAMRIPDDLAQKDAIVATLRDADAKFEGTILAEWGKKWLSIAFEEPDSLE